MTTWNSLGTIAAMLACAACSLPVNAADPAATTPSVDSPPAIDAAQAKRVVRDKATGKLRAPSDEELAEMMGAEAADRRARGLPDVATAPPALAVRQHAGGMLSAVLGQEHLVTITAIRRADGKLIKSHEHAVHEHPTGTPAQRPTE